MPYLRHQLHEPFRFNPGTGCVQIFFFFNFAKGHKCHCRLTRGKDLQEITICGIPSRLHYFLSVAAGRGLDTSKKIGKGFPCIGY